MVRRNRLFAICTPFFLVLCLVAIVSACMSSYTTSQSTTSPLTTTTFTTSEEMEASGMIPSPVLGVLVDEERRVIAVMSDFDEYIGDDLGIQEEDIVLSVNDIPVILDKGAILEIHKSFDWTSELSVLVLRDGEEISLNASLEEYWPDIPPDVIDLTEIYTGLTLEEIDELEEDLIPTDPLPTPTPIPGAEDAYFL